MSASDTSPAAVVMTGQDLQPLAALAAAPRVLFSVDPAGVPADVRVRGVIFGLNVSGIHTGRELKHALRSTRSPLMRWCSAFPKLRHICIVTDGRSTLRSGRALALDTNFASSLHTDVERTHGIYVAVSVIDATDCADNSRLAQRILEHVDDPRGVDPSIAVTWKEIERASIRSILAEEFS